MSPAPVLCSRPVGVAERRSARPVIRAGWQLERHSCDRQCVRRGPGAHRESRRDRRTRIVRSAYARHTHARVTRVITAANWSSDQSGASACDAIKVSARADYRRSVFRPLFMPAQRDARHSRCYLHGLWGGVGAGVTVTAPPRAPFGPPFPRVPHAMWSLPASLDLLGSPAAGQVPVAVRSRAQPRAGMTTNRSCALPVSMPLTSPTPSGLPLRDEKTCPQCGILLAYVARRTVHTDAVAHFDGG